ncbi:MAG: FAD-dependent monooxygenase [Acidobacteria bacterium]|nr:FAD-dependent monooxygenase [Acidobacteriota bacterium]MCA1619834.1 FAD-dependent monooxygenase [Acidobacteriota bacterium]
MTDFDAIIVGGGPAGACAGIELAAAGARVLIAEREKFPREKLCGEFISPECLGHFARLGVLERMRDGGGARVSETVFYAPSGRGVSVPSAWFGGGGEALGLSRAEMDARLMARARAAGAVVLEEASLAGVLTDGARVVGVRLHVDGVPLEFRARVTLDATGRHRAVVRRAERELRGAGAAGEGSAEASGRARLVAFKAHLEGARGAPGVCEIYFYPGGYGGLSPVEGGLSNLCFIARARDVRARASDAERVVREVVGRNRRAAHTLEGARACDRWLGVSVESFGRHEPAPFPGLLAVGDAAAFIDPFTGSGMLMALEGGELAASAVSRWLARGTEDFGPLAREYRAAYATRFDARLRLCGLLRRAALAPPALAEAGVLALGASAALRRRLARATRGGGASENHQPDLGL